MYCAEQTFTCVTTSAGEALERGAENLAAHLRIVRETGLECVVAVNRFPGDRKAEVEAAQTLALELGATAAEVHELIDRVRETVEVVRGLLRDGAVSYRGQVIDIARFDLWFRPLRPAVPIYLSGLFRPMLEVCGEVAQGAILTWSTVDFARTAAAHVAAGAVRAALDGPEDMSRWPAQLLRAAGESTSWSDPKVFSDKDNPQLIEAVNGALEDIKREKQEAEMQKMMADPRSN